METPEPTDQGDQLLALLKRALALADAQGLLAVGISVDQAINFIEPQPVLFDLLGNPLRGDTTADPANDTDRPPI